MLCGCTSAQLEYDRMTGTAFPQPEIVDGGTVNLTTIYLQGDLFLGVNEDDTSSRIRPECLDEFFLLAKVHQGTLVDLLLNNESIAVYHLDPIRPKYDVFVALLIRQFH